MKKFKYLLLIIFIFFMYMNNPMAQDYTTRVRIIKDGTNFRTEPRTSATKIDTFDLDDYYVLVSDTPVKDMEGNKKCLTDWYYVTYYEGVNGYVCGENVEVIKSYSNDTVLPTNSCEQELSNNGIPSSYWGGLCSLKEKHPNWIFQGVKVNLDWNYVVDKESVCGTNYISSLIKNKAFIDTSCSKSSPGGYVPPTQKAVATYMDPRNYFTDKYIFQFLDQGYNQALESIYTNTVSSIINNSNFYTFHKDRGNDLVPIITSIRSSSPIGIAVRMHQELGEGDSEKDLWSGEYIHDFSKYTNPDELNSAKEIYGENGDKYKDYYNFYNWGVSDNCVMSHGRNYCGFTTAYKLGWQGLNNAIVKGADLIAKNYISAGQETFYFQKFNVHPNNESKLFINQYMTNISAPINESKQTFKTYTENNIVNTSLVFKIPVYNNMNVTIVNSASGAQGEDNSSPNPSSIPIPTIVTSSGYRYASGYISNIQINTTVNDVKSTIESVGGFSTVVIKDKDGNVVNDGIMKTGYKVEITNETNREELTVYIKGDTSGDGKINALDLLQVQKNILGLYNLDGAYFYAGETSGDGKINALDLLQVQKNILGLYNIEQ